MRNPLPTKEELILKLDALICPPPDCRAEVTAWAMGIIDTDCVALSDERVWRVLKYIGGADLVGDIRAFLYSNEDFANGKAELE